MSTYYKFVDHIERIRENMDKLFEFVYDDDRLERRVQILNRFEKYYGDRMIFVKLMDRMHFFFIDICKRISQLKKKKYTTGRINYTLLYKDSRDWQDELYEIENELYILQNLIDKEFRQR